MAYEQTLLKAIIRQRARADRVAAALIRQARKELKQVAADAVEVARVASEPVSREQLQRELASLSVTVKMVRERLSDALGQALTQLVETEYDRILHEIERSLPPEEREEVTRGQADGRQVAEAVLVAGMTYKVALERALRRVQEDVEREVMDEWGRSFVSSVDEGYRLHESGRSKLLRAAQAAALVKYVADRVMTVGTRGVADVVLSHVTATLDVTDRMAWGQNRALFVGMMHVAVLDDKLCSTCAELHGTVYYFEPQAGELSVDDMPMVPIHPNCRCIRIGVYERPSPASEGTMV